MKKPLIAVDIDDVLAQGTESLRLEVKKRLGINLLPEAYAVPGDYWHYYERVWEANGVADRVNFTELSLQMVADQSHILPFTNAFEVLTKLSRKYDLIVITARDLSWEPATRAWIAVHFPNIFSDIYFAGRKDSKKTKGEICAELGASWLIDDNIDHAHTALEQGITVVLFGDYGWHKQRDIHEDVVRCKDWRAVQRYFDE
jgi:5'(3')-deoxyribonucleotidase